VALVDVGGDVLAHGHEENLASPLCDSVLLAASRFMQTPVIGAVFGAGCDGELRPAEVLERIAELAAAVMDASSLAEADAIIGNLGIRTELTYERDMARNPI
jgi:hypothetical protein